MIRLPITAKVAFWSFAVAALAVGSALVGVTFFVEHELVTIIDERMSRVARDIFRVVKKQTGADRGAVPVITREILQPVAGGTYVEIFGPDDALLYRSPSLKDATLAGGARAPHGIVIRKQPVRVLTFHEDGFTVLLGPLMKNTVQTLARVRDASILAVPVAAVLGLVGGYWVAFRAMRPVRKLTEAARSISAEDLHRRLPVPAARDDIRDLTNVLNTTLDRLERSYLQAMRFASNASHQLKTPVTVLRAAIEELLRDPNLREEHAVVLNDLLDQTRRLTSLSEGLLLLAQADAGRIETKPRETDIIPIIQRCLEDAEILASNMDIRIETDLPGELPAVADPARTEQVLLNLLDNAVKYNGRGGAVRVCAGGRKDAVFVTVANTGSPIPADRAPWIFDRFARGEADESRSGHGLGLAIARELAVAQGGDIRLLKSDADWTEFEFRLAPPAAQKPDGRITPLLTPPPTRALVANRG
jgi:signal transduction histidine kinase